MSNDMHWRTWKYTPQTFGNPVAAEVSPNRIASDGEPVEIMAAPASDVVSQGGAEGGLPASPPSLAFQLKDLGRERLKITLQQAARDGREDIVKQHLQRLPKYNKSRVVDALDGNGFSALHYAARFNRFKIMQRLVADNAEPEIESEEERMTPLHLAARYVPPYIDEETAQQEAQSSLETLDVTRLSSSKRAVQFLVQYCRVNVNCQSEYGVTPLHLACERNNLPAVEVLLQSPDIDPFLRNSDHDTPLHMACLNGNKEVAEKLLEWMSLERGLELSAENDEKQTALHLACREGFLDIVKLILQYGFNYRRTLVKAADNEGNTPLHLACESGNGAIVQTLLLNGADIYCTNDLEETPLHIAAEHGLKNVAEQLLASGLEIVNVLDHKQHTPLHHAAEHNKVDMIDFLVRKGADIEALDDKSYTPLFTAASLGHAEAFRKLLELGAVIDVVDKDGRSVVFVASQFSRITVLRAIISNPIGAKLCQTTDSQHNTPLHIAAAKGNVDVVDVLLRAGVRSDARNELSKTPMHLAAQNGHVPVIRKLVSVVTSEEVDLIVDEDENGNTSLHLACISGYLGVAKVLLDRGAEPEARNAVLWTPMDCAAAGGWSQIVRLLIDTGADIDPTDRSKTTPLYLAAREGHLKVVNLLMENGADMSILSTSNNYNALDIAIENGHEDVAMAIIKGPKWEVALRNVTDAEWGGVTTPLRKLIRRMPEVAEEVFNRCTSTNATKDGSIRPDSRDYKVFFRYEFLEDFRDYTSRAKQFARALSRKTLKRNAKYNQPEDTSDDTQSVVSEKPSVATAVSDGVEDEEDMLTIGKYRGYTTNWGPVGFVKNKHPLSIMVDSERIDLLKHPLVTSLLNYKWKTYGRFFYFGNLIVYTIFLAFLSTFALVVHSPIEDACMRVFNFNSSSNSSAASSFTCRPITPLPDICCDQPNNQDLDFCCDQSSSRNTFLYVGGIIVIIFAVIRLLMEAFQMYQLKLYYFISWVNWLEITLFVCTIIFVWVFHVDCLCPYQWQWQIGAVAVFLAWIDLVVFIRKLPLTGIYVVMFLDIFYTFCRLVGLSLLLVIAFAIAFYMCFFDPAFSRTPFSSPALSLVKTMTMTTGEFEYDSIFRLEAGGDPGEDPNNDVAFPPVSYLLWIVFLILMPILLTNLLVGLAVDDIKAIQQLAVLKRLALQVELALSVEELFPRRLRRFFIIGTLERKPNRNLSPWEHFRYRVWGGERFDSSEKITEALNPPLEPVEQVQAQTRALVTDVDQMKVTLEDMSERNKQLELVIHELARRQGIVPENL